MSEFLVFDSVTLTGPITCEDLSSLRAVLMRGSNATLPYVPGDVPLPTRLDALDTTLTWFVTGRKDPAGNVHVDREAGAEANTEFYRELFTTGADPGTGQHPVVLHYAGSEFDGDVQVRSFAPVRTGPETFTLLTRLIVAAGELVESGSS